MLNLPANGNGQPAPTLAPQPVPQQAPPTLNPGAMYPGSFAAYQLDINGNPLGQPGQAAPVQPGQMPQPMPGQPIQQPAIDPTIMQTAQQLGVDPAAVARVLQTHQGLQPAYATPPEPEFNPELEAQHRALDGERLAMEANNVKAEINQRAQAMVQQKLQQGYHPQHAQQSAQEWFQSANQQLALAVELRRSEENSNTKLQSAMAMSQQSGMPINDLLQYPDVETMRLASNQYGGMHQELQTMQQQMAQMQQQMQGIAAPVQSFQGAGGIAPMGLGTIEQAYGSGQMAQPDTNLIRFYQSEGIL